MHDTPFPSSLSAIQRTSRRLAGLTRFGFWALPVVVTGYVLLFPELLPYSGGVAIARFAPRPLPTEALLAILAVFWLCALPAMWGMWHLRRLFLGYARGEIFTVDAAARLRQFAWAVVGGGAITPLGNSALSLALSIGLPPGSRMLVVNLSGGDLAFILIGVTLLLIARLMGEAAHIAEDNASIV